MKRGACTLHASISIASAILAALIFVVDLQYPLGVNIPVLYMLPLLLSLWQLHNRDTFIAAAGCTGLTVAALFLSPGGGDWSVGVMNRIFAMVALWTTAFMVARVKQTGQHSARLAAIVESSEDAIIGRTLKGTITSWSPGAERMYGYTASEARGQSIALLIPPDRADERSTILAAIERGERIEHMESVRVRKDGQRIDVSLSVSPVRDSAGRIVGASTIARDVTGQRQAEQAARLHDARIRAILETLVDAIVVIDVRGIIQLVNPAVERLFGYRADEVVGRNVSMLMPSPDRERHGGYLARYLAAGEKRIIGVGREVVGLRKDGSTVPVALAVSEMSVDGEHTFTGVVHDLTERKRIEAQLRERAELARLGQMASVVAHEVRNPLAGIRGVLEVIGARLLVDSRDQGVLKDVIVRLDSLNQFVDDLLVFSRPKPPEVNRAALVPMFQRLVDLLNRDPQFSQIAIEFDGSDVSVEIDQRLMERAFLNLLTNAAQAIKGAGNIRIAIERAEDTCRISIADTGPGIPPDAREKIFEPFFTTKHRGTGLGLSITKRAVEQHGGSITILSTPGVGTTVVVNLPLARSEIGNPAALGRPEAV